MAETLINVVRRRWPKCWCPSPLYFILGRTIKKMGEKVDVWQCMWYDVMSTSFGHSLCVYVDEMEAKSITPRMMYIIVATFRITIINDINTFTLVFGGNGV